MTSLPKRKKVYWEKSYAKVNLSLDVLGKRNDGYHEIRSLFHEIDLCDHISFQPSDAVSITVSFSEGIKSKHTGPIPMKENSVYQAVDYIKSRFNCSQGVDIKIKKNIPMSAGLGGGSSNAATAIRALSELWDLKLEVYEMETIAQNLGSDVPFFIRGGTALVQGRGEILNQVKPLFLRRMLLVKPLFGISSREGYKLFKELDAFKYPTNKTEASRSGFDIAAAHNSLEPGVCRKHPEISTILKYMKEKGAKNAILAGSGSTVIGFYDNDETCLEHFSYFEKKGYWTYVAESHHRKYRDQEIVS